jgi:hypothetical protein
MSGSPGPSGACVRPVEEQEDPVEDADQGASTSSLPQAKQVGFPVVLAASGLIFRIRTPTKVVDIEI